MGVICSRFLFLQMRRATIDMVIDMATSLDRIGGMVYLLMFSFIHSFIHSFMFETVALKGKFSHVRDVKQVRKSPSLSYSS